MILKSHAAHADATGCARDSAGEEMTRISLSDLEGMPSGTRACDDAREWFAEKFPEGTSLKEAWVACPHAIWQVWFACHWLPAEAVVGLAFRFAGQAFRFAAERSPELLPWSDNVTIGNWEAASDATHTATTAAYAAATTAAGGATAAAAAAYAAHTAAYAAAGGANARAEQVAWCEDALLISRGEKQ